MNTDELQAYEMRERDFVQANGSQAVDGNTVVDTHPIYSDLDLVPHLGFHRTGAPLPALLLLYEQTVVYIPPSSKRAIRERLGLPWENLIEFCRMGVIQPIIGHPVHYADKPHFDELFRMRPPSVWARGDELAQRFASGAEYWELARHVLPMDEYCQVPWVLAKWRKHFPRLPGLDLRHRIEMEICTNFVDLCIFGYESMVRDIARVPDRSWAVRRILELSELLTYPSLMGCGGTANYGLASSTAIREAIRHNYLGDNRPRFIGHEIDVLLSGISLTVPSQLQGQAVRRFHQSGMSRRLWRALEELEGAVAEDRINGLTQSAHAASEIVESAIREIHRPEFLPGRMQQSGTPNMWVDMTMKVGSATALSAVAHGPLGQDWITAALSGISVVGLLTSLRSFDRAILKVEEKISESVAARNTSRLAVELWWLTEWRTANPG
ncbi:hypothetical protein [Streptomyces sp. NPDC087856]|uniref:hypothetical protein n=1 Tax=Streptomyces sp. NPDC087856 TaxID=3365811 RepID=UPI003815893E